MSDTPAEVVRARELLEAATPGPWRVDVYEAACQDILGWINLAALLSETVVEQEERERALRAALDACEADASFIANETDAGAVHDAAWRIIDRSSTSPVALVCARCGKEQELPETEPGRVSIVEADGWHVAPPPQLCPECAALTPPPPPQGEAS